MTTRATRSPRRRTVVALAVVLAVLCAFVVRLVDIQVVNAREHIDDSQAYATGAKSTLYGARGEIVDDNGVVLASSTTLYDVQIDPLLAAQGVATVDADGRTIKDDDGKNVMTPWSEVAPKIAAITGQSAADVEKIVADALAADAGSRFAYVKRYVSTEEYRALAELKLPFLTFPLHPARTYPDGAVAGNLIGFVGSDGTPLEGLESLQDSCLQATNGTLTYQRGADGVIIPGTEVEDPAVNGGTLKLTIDSDLQWFMQQLISEETARYQADWGGIIVMEAKTGKIRALAETNTVDPNDPGASDPDNRGSRLLRVSYEPGSTFKPVTAATAIEQAGLSPTSTVETPDRIRFPNGAVINDSESHPTQNLTLTGGLVESSNVAMSQFGSLVSPEVRYDYLKKFGVGGGTALDWSAEPSGEIRDPSTWDNQTYYTTTFGQAFTVTPTQVTSLFQTIANGGVRMPAQLVESCTKPDGTVVTPDLPDPVQVIKPETAAEVSQMLENVYAQGTLADDIRIPGYRLAVKTGTAQVPDGNGGYKDNLYMTSLAGYAPADDPQYVVLTLFNEPKTNTMSSANRSVFKKAMTQVLTHYRVMPSGSDTPLLPVTQ
ncbi:MULTISPECIES: penicillin-binding protein 2 [Microbacterium]|uniref:Penicillin-binding protein 2 n=1 Tax=Microbacterium hominis TaxID=162426 RepID=A0A134DK89_9MICO|nr:MULTISPECIES: penicillin-binding protein 2 [Microbacterium]AUG30056.1 penicillin-binding protein 2 [Microbacterium hominis]KXC06962.1 cell division protein FtsI [Microbacterium hominis]QOC25768.1 penicillin-binding protein 2 [Microbacterium hominis]QOC29755.1 penicillin-binding protein 2 [Microbacterium hominis]QYF97858.1 penicillin-binding protein 2 [Microbacterium sp. PAMC21962]